MTAEFNAGGIWYPVSNGPATLYVLANPTFDFVTPNDSRHIFRPGDTAIVRIRAQDANNSFNRVDFKIGSTTYTVNRAACDLREAGNYVICDINAAGNWSPLTAGTYTASAKVYNTANGNTTKTSRSFDIDDQEPTVSNFVVPALVSSTLSVSVDATDNYSIDKVTFWLAEPATGGVCKNNLPALLTAIGTPSGNTYSASFDTSSLNGPYCVLVSARDISAHNTTPLFKSTLIDNTAPDVPILLSPGNNSAQNFNNFWFDWTDVVDAVSYEVQFSQSNSTDSNGALNVGVWSGDASHNQPTESRAWSSGANGTWYWQVRAVDAAGNKSVWTSTWKMTIDMVAPDVPTASLSQDSNGANVPNGGTTNSQYFTFTLGSSTDTIRYQLRYWNDIPGSPFKAGSPWNPTDLAGYSPTLGIYKDNFTQGDGIHYFSFSACDAAGSCSAYGAPFVVTYDSTAPVLTINSLLSTTNTSPTFTGTTTDPGAPVILTVDSVDHAAMVNPDGTWSATVTGPLTPGSYTAVASSTDASGNASTPANQPFTVTAAVAGVSTNTPSSNTNTNDSGATGANTAGTTTKKKTIVVTSTDSNGEVLAAETTQDAAANTDAQIEEDMSNARSGALGSTTNTQEDGTASTSCSKVLGLCWYYWIPVIVIALVIMGIIYGNRRDRISTV